MHTSPGCTNVDTSTLPKHKAHTTHTIFENGGALLHGVASDLLGPVGGLALGASVFLACMTTSIGLTTSFADYSHELLPSVSYRKITAGVCLFSFAVFAVHGGVMVLLLFI